MIIISFFISIICVALAAGFNSISSWKITQLYPYNLCWFGRDVIYYFLTIPVCLFLLINIILFILVSIRIINHVLYATSPHKSFERMKRCILILISSGITQGIGWFLGVFIQFVHQEGIQIFGWLFVIFNGLEGLFSIILYIVIRSKHMDEPRRIEYSTDDIKSKISKSDRYKNMFIDVNRNRSDIVTRLDIEQQTSRSIDDVRDISNNSWPITDDNDDDIITSYF